ncbi:putative rab GTPase [Paratrimastix pyriformis]|uniref:Rab GTPase n=1 Tax=Paratrimastix pyriformis TaxID=342808 RepID=A0ABQ8UYS8_9EUKA|nr:putative rab GTPase [Paratrimastix pyriformis]
MLCAHRVDNQPSDIDSTLRKALLKQLINEIWVKTADLVPSSLMDHLAHFDDQPLDRFLALFPDGGKFGRRTGEEAVHLYKILVVGDRGVGKTSLIQRYLFGAQSVRPRLTIGAEYSVKVIEWDRDNTIQLQLWDIGGGDTPDALTSAYYRFAVGAVVVFDLTNKTTHDGALGWREDINDKIGFPDGSNIPFVLCANKCDLVPEKSKWTTDAEFIGCFATSSKTGTGFDLAINALVTQILCHSQQAQHAPLSDGDTIPITLQAAPTIASPPSSPLAETCCG